MDVSEFIVCVANFTQVDYRDPTGDGFRTGVIVVELIVDGFSLENV